MEPEMATHSALAFSAWLLLRLLRAPPPMYFPPPSEDDEEQADSLQTMVNAFCELVHNPHTHILAALENFRLCTSFHFFDDDLGYWVKPCSTKWFSRFLLHEYDDTRWIQMFRMTKRVVFALADLLGLHVQRKDTKYKLAIPVLIRVACTLFKFSHGASLFICSELFAIGKSTVSTTLRDVVHAINDTLKHELTWPTGDRMQQIREDFYNLCGLSALVGAIEGTHILISKPKHFPADYFYFKSGGYTLNSQGVVDSQKQFLDLYLGMPGSTNDALVLRRSSLYELATHNNFLEEQQPVDGFTPYLVGDLGYPLLPWLMIPHKTTPQLSTAEELFNKKLRRARCVVENAFGILKQTFREFLIKSDLEVAFLPDAILACAILHNMLLAQSHEEVEHLLQVLQIEAMDGELPNDVAGAYHGIEGMREHAAAAAAIKKRASIGMYLTMQRQHVL